MLSENQMVRIKKAKESMYTGLCTVVEYRKVKNENKSTGFKEEIILEDVPCRLSFSSNSNTNETSIFNGVAQIIKLILSPDVKINPGSKIIVTQNDVENIYKNSGESAVYSTHQEIILELFKGWS
ncbi:MAG TPA: hypothetical protein IAB27_06745 [Candidatus Coprosoma intestinipullorum]|uniref:Phage protein n=1 Tax=Candidatus Coprosoma intestinipullorum TaxID=2840752 RepID=A0A9D0ZS55_9FIRM|nr:hypothetical protein [Candidatus Coprosoma intestinipullorum]